MNKSKQTTIKDRTRDLSTQNSNKKSNKLNTNDTDELKRKSNLRESTVPRDNSASISLTDTSKQTTPNCVFASAYATNSNSTSSQNNSNTTGNCKVICRFRPLNEREKNETKDLCVDFLDPQQIVIRSKAENNSYAFSFDRTFDPNSAQNEIYEYGAKPIVESVLEGFNGTILAYGQTSSGKTHTMQGILDNPEKEGIIPRMIRHVFHHILCSCEELEYTVKVSMIEIYMEKIRDLIDLNKNNLNVREDKVKGVYIEDLSEHYVGSEDDVFELIRIGTENRTVAATMMNEQSSRSHSIFIMSIHQNNTKDLVAKTGKLYLVDLAGSEKIAKTGASGSLLDEAKTINKSLTTLGMVIMALTDGKSSHVPYRESKLTRVLQESLGGNSKTCLITTCSPSSYNECETLSTLRFGMRAKKIKNKPKINKEVTVAELKNEVDKLESLLVACNSRIIQLEKFIIKHNLTPPLEGEEDNSQSSNQVKVQSEMTQEETESRRQFEERLTNLNERKLQEIAVKYSQVIQEVNNLEDEKNEINEKLEEALARYADLTNILEMKEKTIEELRQMNNSYEKNEILLQEKLVLLNEKVMTNENRIKVSDSNKDDQLLNKMLAYIELSNSTTNEDTLNETVTSLFKVLTNKFPYLNDTASKFGNRSIIYNAGELSSIDSKHDMSLSEETIRKERDRFEKEKRIILKNLQEREERVSFLENEQRELNEKIKLLESKMNPEEKNLVKKIVTLEKNLEQVNIMYHQVVTQKSVLKIESQLLDKKVKKRNEKILMLEKENQDLKEQLRIRDEKLSFYQKSHIKTNHNLVKVIKGGHNNRDNRFLHSNLDFSNIDYDHMNHSVMTMQQI